MKNKYKIPIVILILLCAFCMFFSTTVMADIPDQTYTCVGSAAVPDESSLNKYDASGGRFRFKGSNTGTITARCNVTGFETCCEGCLLEVVYEDPGGVPPIFQKHKNTVLVKLIEVSDSGQETVLATFNSNEFVQGPGVRENSVILDLPYDESKAHYVEINVFRTGPLLNNNPGVLLVRLFCTIF